MRLRARGLQPQDTISTGISGLDEVTGGGLPRGRVTVVLGGAGCGKTIFALQTLIAGARNKERGLFITFEEKPDQILKDTRRFDWDLAALNDNGIDFIDAQLSRSIVQGGAFDLLGLLAVVGAKAKQSKAKRIVFDGLDVLLAHLDNPLLIRQEIFRLREWLYANEMTGIITTKADPSGEQSIAEYNFLQFMADCVVVLEHRLAGGAAVRMFRVTKYRGIAHSANEFPFTIASSGIEVAASTSAEIDHPMFANRITSGVSRLDDMLGGGYYQGSSVLISGAPGTSKTTLAAAFAQAACLRKEPTIYVSFDEAPAQIVRNTLSVGIDLTRHIKSGLLQICSLRARSDNAQAHVARIRTLIDQHHARNLLIDPISALFRVSDQESADRAAVQVFDLAKTRGVSTVATSLLSNASALSEETQVGVSTIADTWMHVSYVSQGGERNRALTIIKSRGTAHSNQVRELVLSDKGITLADPYMSAGEVLMGTLRWERENQERHAKIVDQAELERSQTHAELALAETRARIEAARTEESARAADLQRIIARQTALKEVERAERLELTNRRNGQHSVPAPAPPFKRRSAVSK